MLPKSEEMDCVWFKPRGGAQPWQIRNSMKGDEKAHPGSAFDLRMEWHDQRSYIVKAYETYDLAQMAVLDDTRNIDRTFLQYGGLSMRTYKLEKKQLGSYNIWRKVWLREE